MTEETALGNTSNENELPCPRCLKIRKLKDRRSVQKAKRRRSVCRSCQGIGRFVSEETRRKISNTQLSRYNSSWNNSIENRRKLRVWTKAVKERDKHCQHCYSDENLHAHHIVPKSKFPQYAYDLDNGQTLCRDCHLIEHFKKPNNNPSIGGHNDRRDC